MALIEIRTIYGQEGPVFVNSCNVSSVERESYHGDYGVCMLPDDNYYPISKAEFKRVKPLLVKAMAEDDEPVAILVSHVVHPSENRIVLVPKGKADQRLLEERDACHRAEIVGLQDECPPLLSADVMELADVKCKLAEINRAWNLLEKIPPGKQKAQAYSKFDDVMRCIVQDQLIQNTEADQLRNQLAALQEKYDRLEEDHEQLKWKIEHEGDDTAYD